MSRFRLLDINHDWVFGSGQQSYAKDLQALLLNIKTRVLSWVGDCFFDLEAGIDWKNLLDYGQDINLKNAIKSVVFKTPGVVKVSDIEIVKGVDRSARVTFSVDTIYGSKIQNEINV